MKAEKAKQVRLSPVEVVWNELQEEKRLEEFKVPLMLMQDMWEMGRKREVHQGLEVLYKHLR